MTDTGPRVGPENVRDSLSITEKSQQMSVMVGEVSETMRMTNRGLSRESVLLSRRE